MPRTPDSRDGPLYEEKIVMEEQTVAPTIEGECAYVSGAWTLVDAIGAYDPRTGGGTAFPPELNQAVDLTRTTTSALWAQKVKLTTTDLPLGTYFIVVSCILGGTNNNTNLQARVQVNDTTTLSSVLMRNSRANSEWPYAMHNTGELSGVNEVDLDFGKDSGGGSASCEYAVVTLWRIA